MTPISTIAKRLFVAGSLFLVTACGTNGVTDPTAATKKSGYLTVSAAVSGYNVPAAPTTTTTTTPTTTTSTSPTSTTSGTKRPGTMTTSATGYNVPAN